MPDHPSPWIARRLQLALALAIALTGSASACRKPSTNSSAAHGDRSSAAERAATLAALAAERGGVRYLVPVSDADLSRGSAAALVTIVVFLEYRPHEALTLTALEELLAAHPDELRVVIKHPTSGPEEFAARAVLAAHSQARGWSMHEQFGARVKGAEGAAIVQMAKDAGVPDLDRFDQDRHMDPHPELARQAELAERLGVRRTPIMFINGAAYGPAKDSAQLAEIFAAELALARVLVDAGARPDEVYSSFMIHAASKRETAEYELMLAAPYDGPALATRTLASGVVIDDIEPGSGEPFVDGKLATFRFSGYSDATGNQVMGSRDEPAEIICNAPTRDKDPIANAMCDAMLGLEPGGKRRVRIPAAIVEAGAPSRPKIGDLWVALELVGVADAPVRRGEDAFAGTPLASKTRPDGLEIHDYARGEGESAHAGMLVEIHYMMFLTDGTLLDSSHRRVDGLRVTLGKGDVIPGFEAGLEGARVGMLRKLVIPPELGYGDKEQGTIPPSSTLIFLLEIVTVAPAPAPEPDAKPEAPSGD